MSQKNNKKEKKSELKSALLNEGGQVDGQITNQPDNQMMKDLKDRMSSAHRRMSSANKQNQGINFGAINKGFQKGMQQGGKVVECMTPTKIFVMYGVIDIIILVLVLAFTIAYKKGVVFISLTLIYVPNVTLFIAILTSDSVTTRGWYQKWLRFKLVFMGFLLPLIFMHQAESSWEAAICSRQLKNYNIDMTQEEMQTIINGKDFSLLLETDGMQLGKYQQKSKVTDMPISDEVTFADMGKKAGKAFSRLAVLAENTKELSKEELQMRYIQFCGTKVVLYSLAVIVVYQMFQGHQYFVARGRHLEKFNVDEDISKRLNKLNVIHKDKMAKFESGDADFLLKELQAAAKALEAQVELRRQKSVTYSDAPNTGTTGFSTAIN